WVPSSGRTIKVVVAHDADPPQSSMETCFIEFSATGPRKPMLHMPPRRGTLPAGVGLSRASQKETKQAMTPTSSSPTAATRTETDSLGSIEIPADAYWGIHTARA